MCNSKKFTFIQNKFQLSRDCLNFDLHEAVTLRYPQKCLILKQFEEKNYFSFKHLHYCVFRIIMIDLKDT